MRPESDPARPCMHPTEIGAHAPIPNKIKRTVHPPLKPVTGAAAALWWLRAVAFSRRACVEVTGLKAASFRT